MHWSMKLPVLALFLLLATPLAAQVPEPQWMDSLQAYWDRTNAEYRDTAHTPLPPEARAHFTELERYAPDPAFRVTATFKPKQGKDFEMVTTTTRRPMYRSVGTLSFTLKGRKCRLQVYQNIDLVKKPEYLNYLFVPFTDPTNGEATYGGGRYLDLQGPLGREVELDFNRAYNPYCAYGGRYSCPVPPEENHLEVPVEAGVKKFDH
jgi:uncharacterized protein (DUF1684 family)